MVTRIIFVVVLLVSSLQAQTAARPSFEVASIKPTEPGQFKVSASQDPGRVNLQGLPLSSLIARAYRLKTYQITGPDWVFKTRFDITAKLPAGETDSQVPEMLQALLEDRFQLKFHREPKEMPVYALVVGKNGLKVTPVVNTEGGAASEPKMTRFQPGHLTIEKTSMNGLITLLMAFVDRPIIDETNTLGRFDAKLDFALDTSMFGNESGMGAKMKGMQRSSEAGGEAAGADPAAPSIFTAVQEQLGLKLDPRKAPVDTLVIDRLEKAPSEN